MKVKNNFIWSRRCSALPNEQAMILVPEGAPVEYHEANKAYYVVSAFFKQDAIIMHDAVHYGCRVDSNNVECDNA